MHAMQTDALKALFGKKDDTLFHRAMRIVPGGKRCNHGNPPCSGMMRNRLQCVQQRMLFILATLYRHLFLMSSAEETPEGKNEHKQASSLTHALYNTCNSIP